MQTLTSSSSEAPGVEMRQSGAYPLAPATTRIGEGDSVAAIVRWLPSRDASAFPFEAVVADFHRVGKHFVPASLLEALAGARAALPEIHGTIPDVRLLDRFLDAALDKWDGRYANPTYLGLGLLLLPDLDAFGLDVAAAERQYDRLFVQLIADAARFEIAALDGSTELLPQMRPDTKLAAKRCRLALQIAVPAAKRLGLNRGVSVDDPIAGARRLWQNAAASLAPAEHRTLRLTMLPVSRIHDEYQFIRVLQAFEATFALASVEVHAASRALAAGMANQATQRLNTAEMVLHQAAPLFSLVATMRVEAFHTFRTYTEGASAIQSRNYKLLESLCRQPDQARLDSAAYHAVPEVRHRVLAGPETLDSVFEAARAALNLAAGDLEQLEQAMRRFAVTLLRWRRTHHGIAVRMLGERTGTGYTEGSVYLKAVQAIPVFSSLGAAEDGDDEESSPPPREVINARGRCPFAA